MRTAGAMYANAGCGVCQQQEPQRRRRSGRRQTAVFINHTVTMVNIQPTHVPVHGRIRTTFNSRSEEMTRRSGLRRSEMVARPLNEDTQRETWESRWKV